MLSRMASAKGAQRRRGFRRRVRFGPADARLTGHAGVAAVTEADRVLGIADALDCASARSSSVTGGFPRVAWCCRWRVRNCR